MIVLEQASSRGRCCLRLTHSLTRWLSASFRQKTNTLKKQQAERCVSCHPTIWLVGWLAGWFLPFGDFLLLPARSRIGRHLSPSSMSSKGIHLRAASASSYCTSRMRSSASTSTSSAARHAGRLRLLLVWLVGCSVVCCLCGWLVGWLGWLIDGGNDGLYRSSIDDVLCCRRDVYANTR